MACVNDMRVDPTDPSVFDEPNISRADGPEIVVGRAELRVEPGAPHPFPFRVDDIAGVDDRHLYSVSVHVDVDGDGGISDGDYLNEQSYSVITNGFPWTAAVTVRRQ
jgi:hypothetical protein